MRKSATLSLAVAGLMAFGASAVTPIRTEIPNELKDKKIELSAPVTDMKTAFSDVEAKRPFQKISPLDPDGGLRPGLCSLDGYFYYLEKSGISYLERSKYQALTCGIVRSTEENIYGLTGLFSDYGTYTQMEYLPAQNLVRIPMGQKVATAQFQDGSTQDIYIWGYYIDGETNEQGFNDTGDLYLTVEDNCLRVIPSGIDSEKKYIESYGDIIFGVIQNGEKYYTAWIEDGVIAQMNSIVSSSITATGDDEVQYTYVSSQGAWADCDANGDLIVRNFPGVADFGFPCTFKVDRDNKTISAKDLTVWRGVDTNSNVFDFVLVDGENPSETTLEGTYTVDTERNITSITFTAPTIMTAYCADINQMRFGFFEDMAIDLRFNLDDLATSIEGIEAADNTNAPVEYFNLQGVRVNADNLNNGVYIRRQGSDVQKVMVK